MTTYAKLTESSSLIERLDQSDFTVIDEIAKVSPGNTQALCEYVYNYKEESDIDPLLQWLLPLSSARECRTPNLNDIYDQLLWLVYYSDTAVAFYRTFMMTFHHQAAVTCKAWNSTRPGADQQILADVESVLCSFMAKMKDDRCPLLLRKAGCQASQACGRGNERLHPSSVSWIMWVMAPIMSDPTLIGIPKCNDDTQQQYLDRCSAELLKMTRQISLTCPAQLTRHNEELDEVMRLSYDRDAVEVANRIYNAHVRVNERKVKERRDELLRFLRSSMKNYNFDDSSTISSTTDEIDLVLTDEKRNLYMKLVQDPIWKLGKKQKTNKVQYFTYPVKKGMKLKVEGLVRTDPKTCVERVEAVFDTFDLGADLKVVWHSDFAKTSYVTSKLPFPLSPRFGVIDYWYGVDDKEAMVFIISRKGGMTPKGHVATRANGGGIHVVPTGVLGVNKMTVIINAEDDGNIPQWLMTMASQDFRRKLCALLESL